MDSLPKCFVEEYSALDYYSDAEENFTRPIAAENTAERSKIGAQQTTMANNSLSNDTPTDIQAAPPQEQHYRGHELAL